MATVNPLKASKVNYTVPTLDPIVTTSQTVNTPTNNYGQLPPLNSSDPNATVPLSKDAQNMGNTATGTTTTPAATPAVPAPVLTSTGYNTAQGNTDVLGGAQQAQLGNTDPSKSDLQNAISKQTLNFVNNPEGDYNGSKVKQAAMEGADTNWAKQFEGLRQQYGNTSGSGLLQENMLNNALQHQVDMNTLGGQLDQQNYQNYIDAMTKAINTGNTTSQQNANLFTQGLTNASTVRGMGEGERAQTSQYAYDSAKTATENAQQLLVQSKDIQGQQDLATLQGKIQSGQQLQSQDFTATQSALDRAFKNAQQSNDIQAQKDITTLKGQIDAQAQKAQNEFVDTQRVQTHLDNLDTLGKTQGFEAAMQKSQQDAAAALKAGDWASAASIQKAQLTYQAQKDQQDLTVSMAGLALQGKQIDLNGQKMTFDQIEEGIKNGQIDPKAGTDAIAAAAKSIGVTVQAADPDAAQKAATKQYNDMQFSFGISHPDMVHVVDQYGNEPAGGQPKTTAQLNALLKLGGKIDGLTEQGNSAFNDYVNKSTATQTDTGAIVAKAITDPTSLQGSASDKATNHADYQALLQKSSVYEGDSGSLDHGTYKFTKATPAVNTVFRKEDGTLYIATSGVQVEKRDWAPDKQYFTAIDVDTGKEIKIYG